MTSYESAVANLRVDWIKVICLLSRGYYERLSEILHIIHHVHVCMSVYMSVCASRHSLHRWCGREFNSHLYRTASLKHHASDTLQDIPPGTLSTSSISILLIWAPHDEKCSTRCDFVHRPFTLLRRLDFECSGNERFVKSAANLGQGVEFDYIGSWSLSFHFLSTIINDFGVPPSDLALKNRQLVSNRARFVSNTVEYDCRRALWRNGVVLLLSLFSAR